MNHVDILGLLEALFMPIICAGAFAFTVYGLCWLISKIFG